MKILILGDTVINHMRVQGKEWDNYYKLKYHLKIKNWEDFINYIKKYKEKEK